MNARSALFGGALQTQGSPIKIGFVLLSSSRHPIASTRIAVLNVLPFLRESNFDPHIVFEPSEPTETPNLPNLAPSLLSQGFRVVVFQKVHGPSVERLSRTLSDAGVKTVFSVCDRVNPRMAAATDATITVTDYLKSLYPVDMQAKIHVVHDGIERPEICKSSWRDDRGSRAHPLRAVLVTSHSLDRLPVIAAPPNWLHVTIIGRYPRGRSTMQQLRQIRWKLAQLKTLDRVAYARFLANSRIQCFDWHSESVYRSMQQSDIGIIPIEPTSDLEPGTDVPTWKVKSENRLTMKMAVGLPVIASPIPAYEAVVDQGRNAFIAETQRDWMESLEALRDPKLRFQMGQRARQQVLDSYSMQEQSRRLVDVLRALIGTSN